jgi:adenylosuccinate synthase
MPAIVLVGTQWGDEGKGRMVDWLSGQVQVVARYNGGDNAGHTVVAEGRTFKFHLVPSGILHLNATCLIGGGVVVNPATLVAELDELIAYGVDVGPERIKLAAAAHVILPTHRALDAASEAGRGKTAIGTTNRGIGPVYADKAARTGLRAGMMLDPESFSDRVAELVAAHNRVLQVQYGRDPLPAGEIAAEYCAYARRLKPHLVDGSELVANALAAGQTVLCEGAQGLLLDLDRGTYPYVTSSSTSTGGALTGLGFGPQEVKRVIGIAKAYTTRVGAGPFPTELNDEVGERIRKAGAEFGTTTGRPRRCGWLDLPVLRYAVQVNGMTEIALTKLDVLSGIDPLRVAVAYERDGERTTRFPAEFGVDELAGWWPVYEEMAGWDVDLSPARRREDLPLQAQAYVARIEEQTGAPITMIGVGPGREQTIWEDVETR